MLLIVPRPDPESISFVYGIMSTLGRKIEKNGLPNLQYRIFKGGPTEALQLKEGEKKDVLVIILQADLGLAKSNPEWLSDFRDAFPHARIYVLDGWDLLRREKGLEKADGFLNSKNGFEIMDMLLEIVQEDIHV